MTQKLRKGSKAYLEKNEASVTRDHEKNSPGYSDDRRRYGKAVADFNAGFLVGWNDQADRCAVALRALDRIGLSLANRKHTWTKTERKAYETAIANLKRSVPISKQKAA